MWDFHSGSELSKCPCILNFWKDVPLFHTRQIYRVSHFKRILPARRNKREQTELNFRDIGSLFSPEMSSHLGYLEPEISWSYLHLLCLYLIFHQESQGDDNVSSLLQRLIPPAVLDRALSEVKRPLWWFCNWPAGQYTWNQSILGSQIPCL